MNHISHETMKDLDLEKYMGKWYEIARYRFKWEKDCERSIANYTWDPVNQKVLVENQCWVDNKMIRSRKATAWVQDPNDKGKLMIQFDDGLPADFGPSPYWVHWSDYNNAIVGGPSGRFLWWLSRNNTVKASDVEPMLKVIRKYGYDTDKLMANPMVVIK